MCGFGQVPLVSNSNLSEAYSLCVEIGKDWLVTSRVEHGHREIAVRKEEGKCRFICHTANEDTLASFYTEYNLLDVHHPHMRQQQKRERERERKPNV